MERCKTVPLWGLVVDHLADHVVQARGDGEVDDVVVRQRRDDVLVDHHHLVLPLVLDDLDLAWISRITRNFLYM